jgi:hypothetical protein
MFFDGKANPGHRLQEAFTQPLGKVRQEQATPKRLGI